MIKNENLHNELLVHLIIVEDDGKEKIATTYYTEKIVETIKMYQLLEQTGQDVVFKKDGFIKNMDDHIYIVDAIILDLPVEESCMCLQIFLKEML